MAFELSENKLRVGSTTLIEGLQAGLEKDAAGVGVFLRFTAEKPADRLLFPVGTLPGLERFISCQRRSPFWMVPAAGATLAEVKPETQFFLAQLAGSSCLLLVPMVDEPFRCALSSAGGGLQLIAETGDPATVGDSVVGLFAAVGDDPYALLAEAAGAIAERLGTVRLRVDKPLPAFVDQLGWCTWDTFYADVTAAKMREGLESFKKGGLVPPLVILDSGWQPIDKTATRETRATSLGTVQETFPGGLAPTVQMAKNEFGVKTFIAWHALNGSTGGLDPQSFRQYDVRMVRRRPTPGIIEQTPNYADAWWGENIGLISPRDIARFYQDFHRELRRQGVDGVKVDFQAQLEEVAYGTGSRATLMRQYHEALEGSVAVHFGGNIINCMSLSNDMLFAARASTIARTSDDFYPKKAESHAQHLTTNAYVTLFFGHFVHPDWDMFHSQHEHGSYHAAGRAISGGPVYVSDEVDKHDFAILRQLALPDGRVLRPTGIAVPSPEVLFHNPIAEPVALKVFNTNATNAVVGVFHSCFKHQEAISATLSPEDVPGLAGTRFVVFAHQAQRLFPLDRGSVHQLSVDPMGWELFTIAPIVDGLAVIGLPRMLNSGGGVLARRKNPDGSHTLTIRPNGTLLLYSQHAPRALAVNGAATKFTHDSHSGELKVEIPFQTEPVEMVLTLR